MSIIFLHEGYIVYCSSGSGYSVIENANSVNISLDSESGEKPVTIDDSIFEVNIANFGACQHYIGECKKNPLGLSKWKNTTKKSGISNDLAHSESYIECEFYKKYNQELSNPPDSAFSITGSNDAFYTPVVDINGPGIIKPVLTQEALANGLYGNHYYDQKMMGNKLVSYGISGATGIVYGYGMGLLEHYLPGAAAAVNQTFSKPEFFSFLLAKTSYKVDEENVKIEKELREFGVTDDNIIKRFQTTELDMLIHMGAFSVGRVVGKKTVPYTVQAIDNIKLQTQKYIDLQIQENPSGIIAKASNLKRTTVNKITMLRGQTIVGESNASIKNNNLKVEDNGWQDDFFKEMDRLEAVKNKPDFNEFKYNPDYHKDAKFEINNDGTVNLYRAVSPEEFDSIKTTKTFTSINNSYKEGKFFTNNMDNAAKFGIKLKGSKIIKIKISYKYLINQHFNLKQDGIGESFDLEMDLINNNAIIIIPE